MISLIAFGILRISLAFVHVIQHFVLATLYHGKGKIVPPVKNPLLLKSATNLTRDIREGKCKSEDVIQAYIDRILEVEPYINATADRCFEDALEKAREVDELIASGKYTQEQLSFEKPLLGIPFSVKCLFHVKDMPCTAGSLFFSDIRATEDADVVAALKNAGAIVIATTNAPEMGMHIETRNKLYGTTCNPYDTNRTPGGSSGGEAALIGAGASVLGLGNDFLGSLRIPAHYTGIFSHKPTKKLVSNHGSLPLDKLDASSQTLVSEVNNILTSGPMCRYSADLITSMKILSLEKEVKMKFDHPVDFQKVKIYYLKEIRSPLVTPVDEEITAGLEKAVTYFQKQYNITPKEVEMPSLFDVNRCIPTVLGPTFKNLKISISGHKGLGIKDKEEFVKFLLGESKICASTAVAFFLILNPLVCRKSQSSYYQKMLGKWMDEFKNLLDEDSVLLMPTLPFTAPYHLESFAFSLNVCYTSVISVLGLPATHCPMGLTKNGLPFGIQIVGCQNNDPLTIACAVELERAFGGWKSH